MSNYETPGSNNSGALAEDGDEGPRAISSGRLRFAGVLGLVVAALVVAGGIYSRASDRRAVAKWTAEQAIPTVAVVRPSAAGGGAAISLPGRLEAWYRAPIYARVSGYLKHWYTDIGAKVKAGQVLAEIETPDLDQQLEQAKAELATARANESLAETTAQRWQLMLKSDSVSRQAADEKSGDLDAKRTIRAAAEANVQRLQALESFKKITAPFDGVVTSRSTDVGALINAGGGTGPQLFTVSDVHQLRVYVSVPQSDAAMFQPGMAAKLTVPDQPGKAYAATVDTTAGAVNVESGTVLIQLSLTDPTGSVMPGAFATVQFDPPAEKGALRLPSSALIFRAQGLQVAALTPNDRVSLRSITVKRDLGSVVEVASGVQAEDRVVDNPPDALLDGDEVHVAPEAGSAPKPAAEPRPGDAHAAS
jgi:RND family efflux transporter MFP subunit